MCFMCEGGTADELLHLIRSHVDEYGWHVAGVEPDGPGLGWAYTIGLLERFDHPELIMTGICCGSCAMSTLNGIGKQVAEGARFSVGDTASDPDGPARARFGPVHQRQWQTQLFNVWRAFYDDQPWAPTPAALQVIAVDRRGRWQDDPGNRRWRHQRLDRPPCLDRRC